MRAFAVKRIPFNIVEYGHYPDLALPAYLYKVIIVRRLGGVPIMQSMSTPLEARCSHSCIMWVSLIGMRAQGVDAGFLPGRVKGNHYLAFLCTRIFRIITFFPTPEGLTELGTYAFKHVVFQFGLIFYRLASGKNAGKFFWPVRDIRSGHQGWYYQQADHKYGAYNGADKRRYNAYMFRNFPSLKRFVMEYYLF